MKVQKNYLLAPIRLLLIIFWVLVMPLVFLFGKLIGWQGHSKLPHAFHRGMCKLLGLDVTVSGECYQAGATLYVSNHISYLDIFALGDVPAYFIAKSEVASWPVLGTLAKFQNTLFIERKRGRAKKQLYIMKAHLQEGKNLILFPEGTSTGGVHVEPFKSSLFEAARLSDKENAMIQPVTIAYTHQAGNKMNQSMLDHYAWYADMPFGSHALALLPLKKVNVKVHFHPVCSIDEFETRKQCADHCQQLVADKLAQFLDQ